MQKIISSASAKTYKHVFKPLLFTQKPDGVHNKMLSLGGFLQKSGTVRSLTRSAWAYQNTAILRQNVVGLTFNNPVGLSAGFDKNFELAPMLKAMGFGFMEGGSLTFHQCDGNPRPWFYRLPKTQSLVVYAGLANQGVVRIVDRIKAYPQTTFADFPLNISVAKTNSKESVSDAGAIDDYIGSLQHIKSALVGDMITLNISCPNTYGGEPFTTPKRLDTLLKKVDSLGLVQPLFIKMPSDLTWKNFDALLQVAIKHTVAGVTISNLAKDRGQVKLMDPLPDSVKGNLSGKPTWNLSNTLIKNTYKKYGEHFVIIGVGGIFSAQDAYTKIRLGATLVELITGMIFEGPQLIGQINKGLAELLKKDGFSNISQAIGVDNQTP